MTLRRHRDHTASSASFVAQHARQAGKATGVRSGSYASMLDEPLWRKHSLFGMLLCVAGVIGLSGIGLFSPELVGAVIRNSLRQSGVSESQIGGGEAAGFPSI